MQISWLFLAPALVLLLVPIGLFNSGLRHRAIHSEWRGYWKRILSLPQHYLDLVRAFGGAWLLTHSVAPNPDAAGLLRFAAFGAVTASAVVAVALQALVCRERDSVHAPFAFLIGLALGVLPPLTAGAALIFAFTLTVGSRVPALFFFALAASSVVFGFVFIGPKAAFVVAPMAAAALLPWLASLLLHRELVVTHRPRAVTGKHSPLRD
jgi:hypothetical protein